MGKIFGGQVPTGGFTADMAAETTSSSGIPWGGIGKGLGLAGAGLQAFGEVQAADEANAAGMRADKVARMQAKEIENKTTFDLSRQTQEADRGLDEMRVQQAAAGGGMNLLALAKQASENELANLIGAREGAIQAGQARYEGKIARWQGKMAQKQGYLKAGGTALTGFAMGMA